MNGRSGGGVGRCGCAKGACQNRLLAVTALFIIGRRSGAIGAARIVPIAEQRLLFALDAPGVLRFVRALLQRHLGRIDRLDPGGGDGVVDAARIAVALGQDDAVAAQLVDRADMPAIA